MADNPRVCPMLSYQDAPAAIELLGKAFGFEELSRMEIASAELPRLGIVLWRPNSPTLAGIRGRAIRTKQRKGLDAIIVDFIQEVKHPPAAPSKVEEVSAIDLRGDRGIMLYQRGGMDFLDISTPLETEVIDRYRRERDLTRWKGVKLLSDKTVMSFGPDGV